MGIKYQSGGEQTASKLTTTGAVDWEAPAGENLVEKLGDAAGVNKKSWVDSEGVEVAFLDSDGKLTPTSLEF